MPQIETEASDNVPAGSVTRTDPPFGTEQVPGGSTIKMYVSTGSSKVNVPPVVGLSVSQASSTLAGANLKSTLVFQSTNQQGNDGKVFEPGPAGRHAGGSADHRGADRRRVHRADHDAALRRHDHHETVTRARTGVLLSRWYRAHGRHDLPWRATRDRWRVLVSEVMLHQTQAPRVAQQYDAFVTRFPTPAATAAERPGAVIEAWGRLGYPRRARWLWEAACRIDAEGWPADLAELPGVGRYTAAAVAAQCDDTDVIGIEVNVRRVCERVQGVRLSTRAAEEAAVAIAAPLRGRDRLLALMDLGAVVCTARNPRCDGLPDRARLRDARPARRRDAHSAVGVQGLVPRAARPGARRAAARSDADRPSSTAKRSRRCSTTGSRR